MPIDLKKLKVLVVEDVDPMRKIIVSVVEMMSVGRVFAAENGETAFNIFRRENPDIVITDWSMEPMDGLQLTHEIRTNMLSPNRTVPIIMISGYSYKERIDKARDAGVTEFLVKPFSADDLAKRIAYVINSPRDFIDAPGYFGPDRRRRTDKDFKGPYRRETDR